ncbi:hypothetical protein QB910_000092 [Dabrowskivirus KKP3916]|uniref:HTH cro/C1-type domain-containing protein n=1 Tax=Alicyclobacillus phage KKP_3916 TaxID=3040651 RepID=A0AAT9V8B8_9CAUD|nr:hypothetical protein QB910_000092 [Alicyclobacillus phage KKP 3916]
MQTVGRRLRDARKLIGLSQVQVMNLVGVNNKTLSAYERDEIKPDIDTLRILADLYNVSLDYLIKGRERSFSESKIVQALLSEVQASICTDSLDNIEIEKIKRYLTEGSLGRVEEDEKSRDFGERSNSLMATLWSKGCLRNTIPIALLAILLLSTAGKNGLLDPCVSFDGCAPQVMKTDKNIEDRHDRVSNSDNV